MPAIESKLIIGHRPNRPDLLPMRFLATRITVEQLDASVTINAEFVIVLWDMRFHECYWLPECWRMPTVTNLHRWLIEHWNDVQDGQSVNLLELPAVGKAPQELYT